MKITGRDVKFLFIGMMAIILLDVIVNWKGYIQAYNDGYNIGNRTEAVK